MSATQNEPEPQPPLTARQSAEADLRLQQQPRRALRRGCAWRHGR